MAKQFFALELNWNYIIYALPSETPIFFQESHIKALLEKSVPASTQDREDVIKQLTMIMNALLPPSDGFSRAKVDATFDIDFGSVTSYTVSFPRYGVISGIGLSIPNLQLSGSAETSVYSAGKLERPKAKYESTLINFRIAETTRERASLFLQGHQHCLVPHVVVRETPGIVGVITGAVKTVSDKGSKSS